MARHRKVQVRLPDEDENVRPIELFFDLVFVFALTQVTARMAVDLSLHGLIRGLLILGLLWWSWVGYSWLGNVVRPDAGITRLTLFFAMAAMFVLALAIPEAFDDLPGGLPGPVVVAVCYFLFRAAHLTIFFFASRGDAALRRQLYKFTPSMLGGTLLLLAASQFHGAAQTWLWAAALLADYLGTWLGGAKGWRIKSAAHFAERHSLILIVALGESIIALGVGVAALPISWPIVVASVFGIALSASLWWTYFEFTQGRCEHAFATADDRIRPRLARDAYSFMHLPLFGGVVLIALGMKKVLEYVGDSEKHTLSDALHGLGLNALYIGVAVYLITQVVIVHRLTKNIDVLRIGIAVLVVVLLPVVGHLPALASLAIVSTVCVVLVVCEMINESRLTIERTDDARTT